MNDERVVELLEEMLTWTRFMARNGLEDSLRQTLVERKHQIAYEATDGVRTQSEVGKLAGLDQTTISDLWSRWRRLGLLHGGKRPKHLVSLEDMGWDVSTGRARAAGMGKG